MNVAGALALNAALFAFAAMIFGLASMEAHALTFRRWAIAATSSFVVAIALGVASAWAAVIWP